MTRQTVAFDATPDRLTSVNAVLRAQLHALAQIEAILGQEHEALEQRNPEALLTTADAKTQALARLGELEDQRKSISASLNPSQMIELQEITARCRSMNQANAAMLGAQQQHVNRLLGLLRGNRDARPSSYDATGKTTGYAAKQLRLTQA